MASLLVEEIAPSATSVMMLAVLSFAASGAKRTVIALGGCIPK